MLALRFQFNLATISIELGRQAAIETDRLKVSCGSSLCENYEKCPISAQIGQEYEVMNYLTH
jgi:hypothetical protein